MSNKKGWGNLIARKHCQKFLSQNWINQCSGEYPDYLITRWKGKLIARNTAYTVFKLKDQEDLMIVFDYEPMAQCNSITWTGMHDYTCTQGNAPRAGKTDHSLLACLPYRYALADDLIDHCAGKLSTGYGWGSILGIKEMREELMSHTLLYFTHGQNRLLTIASFNLKEKNKDAWNDTSTDGGAMIGLDMLLLIILVLLTMFFLLRHI